MASQKNKWTVVMIAVYLEPMMVLVKVLRNYPLSVNEIYLGLPLGSYLE